mgnify:CR=1 FL=1
MLTLASLFDGVGGWQLAAVRSDVKPLWSSEIEPFAKKVTAAHFPETKQLGDINEINGGAVEPVDIICAGSPCQDLSIAGKRAGLEGKRSNLFYQAMRIVREMQVKTNGLFPKFFIWENVTGAFSSNERRDFQAVLEEIGQTDIPIPGSGRWARAGMVRGQKCGIAWRTLDAQFWGVPQHRERIFLIAGFGNWGGTVEVLFECESVQGNTSQGQREGEGTSLDARKGSFETGRNDIADMILCDQGGERMDVKQGVVSTLRATSNHPPIIFPSKSYSEYAEGKPAATLKAQGGVLGGGSENLVVEMYENHPADARINGPIKVAPTLSTRITSGGSPPLVCQADSDYQRIARRITPLEAERLQGLPDNWTAYGSDTARYKAIGNGMAQPCADYVMQQVVKALERGENDFS